MDDFYIICESKISTHAPLAGRDPLLPMVTSSRVTFQPTRPLRGATTSISSGTTRRSYFNPRAPCGARLPSKQEVGLGSEFQPTRPLRGATVGPFPADVADGISTHAPLAGRDPDGSPGYISPFGFQPTRPLRGATQSGRAVTVRFEISTHAPLAGRDDLVIVGAVVCVQISTHAPLAGRDPLSTVFGVVGRDFNPRAPCGARLLDLPAADHGVDISTHAPLAGRDLQHVLAPVGVAVISTHAPLAGRDVT